MYTEYRNPPIWSIVTDILRSQTIRIMDDAAHILFVGLYMPLLGLYCRWGLLSESHQHSVFIEINEN